MGSVGLIGACSEEDTSLNATLDALDPPVLEINSLLNASSTEFAPDAGTVHVTCDPRLTVKLGPATTDGQLENWYMRPRGNCAEVTRCGFVRVELKDVKGSVFKTADAALINVVFDLSEAEVTRLHTIEATLIQGTDNSPYLVEGNAVSDSIEITATQDEDCVAAGGAGGTGGGIGGSAGEGPGGFGGA